MNTTLDPNPTDREREMLAEWAIRFCTMQHELNHPECTLSECFDFVETMLTEFRTRYGVTGAEPEVNEPAPIREADITLEDAIQKIQRLIDEGGYGESYTSGMRLCVSILKGGPHETI